MYKNTLMDKVLTTIKEFRDNQSQQEKFIQALKQITPNVSSLTPQQNQILKTAFHQHDFIQKILGKYFQIFFQFFLNLYKLPPMTSKQPKIMKILMNSTEVKYKLIQLYPLANKYILQKQLYIGFKILQSIQTLHKNNQNPQRYKQWYEVIIGILGRVSKFIVEQCQKQNSNYKILFQSMLQLVKNCLQCCRHRPQNNQNSKILRHFQLLFFFDVQEGLMNIKHVKKLDTDSLRDFEKNYIDHYFLQLGVKNCIYDFFKCKNKGQNQKQRNYFQYNMNCKFNIVGLCYALSKIQLPLVYSNQYYLKLYFPLTLSLLKEQKPYKQIKDKYVILLINYLSRFCAQKKQKINNLSQWGTKFHNFIEIWQWVGQASKQYQQYFVQIWNRFQELLTQKCLSELYLSFFKTKNISLASYLLMHYKQLFIKLNEKQTSFTQVQGVQQILKLLFEKVDGNLIDKIDYVGKIINLLIWMKQKYALFTKLQVKNDLNKIKKKIEYGLLEVKAKIESTDVDESKIEKAKINRNQLQILNQQLKKIL